MRQVVCMITDRLRLGEAADAALVRRVALAARAGIHLVQIRERDMPDGALARLVAAAVAATHRTRTRILVNDRLDVAIAAGAHGVHLRADSVPARRARLVAPPGFLIGRSVHSPDEAARACREGGLDYLLFGTVFPTASKPGQLASGVAGLSEVVAAARTLPVLAVGGITTGTVRQLAGSGCAGCAAISLFADGPEAELSKTVTDVLMPWENQ